MSINVPKVFESLELLVEISRELHRLVKNLKELRDAVRRFKAVTQRCAVGPEP